MTDTVFVIGSKPNSIFPDVKPTIVFAANGAIARAQVYVSEHKVPLTGILWQRFLVAKEESRHSPTAVVLNGCRGDRLIISGAGPKKANYDTPRSRGLQFRIEKRLSRTASMRLKLQYASIPRLVNDLRQDLGKRSAADFMREMRRKRSLDYLGISTGLLAVLLALREAGRNSCVYAIGIGIDEQEGQFYDSGGIGRFRHVNADKAMVRDLVRKVPDKRVVFTDPKLAAYVSECRAGNYQSVDKQ